MSDATAYADFMDTLTAECLNVDSWNEAYDLMHHPSQLLAMVTGHMRTLYEDYLRPEWERVLPMLQESVAAFQKLDFENLTVYEAIRAVTGRDMTNKLTLMSESVDRLIFMPTAHIGPYIGQYPLGKTLYIMFGARLPRGAQAHSSDLSRAELLIRLNALADDTRLRILEMLTHDEELYAQDIIEQLGLSQSTVSRHLSQLSASGYVTERRRDVAKCYSLNTDRVMDTLRALTNFLARQ
jgi:DNA-binding transcriptional ArsR family regulator